MPTTKAEIHYVAIDISKATLQVQDEHCSLEVGNDPPGHRKLLGHLKSCNHPLVVFEASGGYERKLMAFLVKEGMAMVLVNPARVRDYARSEGVRAKTDPIDGKMILAFARENSVDGFLAIIYSASMSRFLTKKLAMLLSSRAGCVEK